MGMDDLGNQRIEPLHQFARSRFVMRAHLCQQRGEDLCIQHFSHAVIVCLRIYPF